MPVSFRHREADASRCWPRARASTSTASASWCSPRRRQRQRADAAGGRGHPQHRLAGDRLRARAATSCASTRATADVRLQRGGAAPVHAQRAVARSGRVPAPAPRGHRQAAPEARLRVRAQLKRRDGTLFWARLQAQSVDLSNPIGGGTIWTAEDITERRQTQHALADARDAAGRPTAPRAPSSPTPATRSTPLNGLLGLARLAMQPGAGRGAPPAVPAQMIDSTQA